MKIVNFFFWETHFRFHFRFTLPHFCFFNFCQNLEILSKNYLVQCAKFGVSVFLSFGDNVLNTPLTVTCMCTHTFSKITFWTQRTSKYISQTKIPYRKSCTNAVLPLSNSSQVSELIIQLLYCQESCSTKLNLTAFLHQPPLCSGEEFQRIGNTV